MEIMLFSLLNIWVARKHSESIIKPSLTPWFCVTQLVSWLISYFIESQVRLSRWNVHKNQSLNVNIFFKVRVIYNLSREAFRDLACDVERDCNPQCTLMALPSYQKLILAWFLQMESDSVSNCYFFFHTQGFPPCAQSIKASLMFL